MVKKSYLIYILLKNSTFLRDLNNSIFLRDFYNIIHISAQFHKKIQNLT